MTSPVHSRLEVESPRVSRTLRLNGRSGLGGSVGSLTGRSIESSDGMADVAPAVDVTKGEALSPGTSFSIETACQRVQETSFLFFRGALRLVSQRPCGLLPSAWYKGLAYASPAQRESVILHGTALSGLRGRDMA